LPDGAVTAAEPLRGNPALAAARPSAPAFASPAGPGIPVPVGANTVLAAGIAGRHAPARPVVPY